MNDLSSVGLLNGLPPQWRHDAPRRIGAFVVHPASNELAGALGTIRVRPRLMDVLLRLAADPGAVVPRNRLLEEVWPRRMVSDEVLSRTIAELRTVLGDDPRHPTYIETIPTVGYRLVAVTANVTPGVAGACATVAIAPDAAAINAPAGMSHACTPAVVTPAPNPTVDDAATAPVIEAPFATQPAAAPAIARADARGRRAAWIALTLVAIIAAAWSMYRESAAEAPKSLAARIANAAPLSSEPGLEMEPRFAPDGKRVAWSASAEFGKPAHLVVQDRGASTARRALASTDPVVSYRSPVFVGGSARIAFARCVDTHCRIIARDLDSGAEQVLVGDERAPLPNFDVSADGRALVYANMQRAQFPAGLALLELDTHVTRDLTLPGAGDDDDAMPRFSPDATRVAFFRGGGGGQQLWTMQRDGSRPEAASNARGAAYGAAWRDTRHVLVAADWFGFRAMNEVDLVRHEASFVGARGARFPDVAPGGEIVYENAQFRADLWQLDPVTGTLGEGPLWPSTRFTMNQEFSPDGNRVVFVSNREGVESLFVATRGGAPVRLDLPDHYRYVNAHWSHDGRALYSMRLDANPPHTQSVVRIDVDTGAIEPLDMLGTGVYEVFADRAGRNLYYAVDAGQAMRLMRAPLADLRAQQALPLPLASNFMIDATHVAFTQLQIRGLTLCNLDDLVCEALPLPISDATQGAWTLGAGAVWYLDTSATPYTLARYDVGEKRVTMRTPSRPMAFGRTIAVAPDGASVLLAREAPTLIDLMIAR